MEERKMIETIVETWCESMAAEGENISREVINSKFNLDGNGMLTATMPSGSDIQFKFDTVSSLMFNVISHDLRDFEGLGEEEKKDLLNDVLIVCTVEFNAIGADIINPPKYVFVVNSRIGESITVIP